MNREQRRQWIQSLTPEQFAEHLESEAAKLEGEAKALKANDDPQSLWLAEQALDGADNARAEAALVRTFPKPHRPSPS